MILLTVISLALAMMIGSIWIHIDQNESDRHVLIPVRIQNKKRNRNG